MPLPGGVRQIEGEQNRFYVTSRTRSDIVHIVDLEEYGWNAECSCEFFNFKLLPKLEDDQRLNRPPRPRRCWHIHQALEFTGELAARLVAGHNAAVHRINQTSRFKSDEQDYVLR